ncbi:MAG: hypothetical protein KF751_16880 [Nitrospira sp.]|nr:hypothetical protein [Nitrospira sp.]
MSAFTEEQMKILNTAFDHTSRRVWESQRELSRVYGRLSALCAFLEEEKLVNTFHVLLRGTQVSMVWKPDTMDGKFDRLTMHRILEGDLSASEHCFKREEEALRIRQAEYYKRMCQECRSFDNYEEDEDGRDICDLASAYDGGQVLYNRKNPLDVERAQQRCEEEWEKKQLNVPCHYCGTWFYSKDEEERQKSHDAYMQRILPIVDAAGEPAPRTEG